MLEEPNPTTLGAIVTIKSGVSPSAVRLSGKGDFPFVKVEDLNNCGKYQTDARERTSSNEFAVPAGAVIFPKRGAAITNNKVRVAAVPVVMDTNMMALIPDVQSTNTEFLYYLIISEQLARIADTSSIPQINNKHIIPHRILLPPLPEQRKIAEILRTWDEAIDACARLIEQKRLRLASARQHIFGREGLPPDTWPSAKLASLVERIQRRSVGEEHPVMTISGKFGFRRQDEKFARFMAGESVSRYLLLKRGEFAYNKGNSKTFPQGCIYRLEQDTALVPFVYFAFALSDDLDSDFYAHLFASGFLNRQLGRLVNSGVRNDGLLNIYADDFFGCEVPVPSRSEQESIGQLFNAFDEELTALGKQLEHLRQQKRGLMQKLLTGEWRVDVEEG